MRFKVFVEFFDKLAAGDPIAIGFAVFFFVFVVAAGLFTLKIRRDLRRDDEKQDRRYGRNLKK